MNEKSFQDFLEKNFLFSYGYGIGDDAALINNKEPGSQVITKDILIENVHFKMDYFSLKQLAQKAVAVNLSDIAAMGAVPEYFFLGLGMQKKYQKDIKEFFKGISKSCELYNIELGGGDYSNSDLLMISITMMGRAVNPVFRNKAEPGDHICITKNPGESALGLNILQLKKDKDVSDKELFFINKHKSVIPELQKGQLLSEYVNSMMDVSDGLIKDLNRILSASNMGAVINYDKIPVSENFKLVCSDLNINERELVLGGGEDYGLLFTISKKMEKALNKQSIEYSIIGEITENHSLSILEKNRQIKNDYSGYDHFLSTL